MIRIVKITSMTFPNPDYGASDAKGINDRMGLKFAPGQPMVAPDWADIFETPLAGPLLVQIDADRSMSFLVKDNVTDDLSIICNLKIWTDDAGLICMSGDTYYRGKFSKKISGPIAYVVGQAGTLFLPAKRVITNDIV